MNLKKLSLNISRIKKSVLVKDIMSRKVVTLSKDDAVYKAVELMDEKTISTVVISDGTKPIGIVTERDFVGKVLLKKKNPKKIKLSEIMTKNPITIEPRASIHKASVISKNKRVRHLLVVDHKGQVLGLVSQTDIVQSFNRIYSNYKYLLWDPWLGFIFFLLISVFFLLNLILFQK